MVEAGIKREIIARIGRIVVFDPLSEGRRPGDRPEDAGAKPSHSRCADTHGVEVSFSEDAMALIAEMGYEPENGSRPLRGVIEREVEDRLSDLILDGKVEQGLAAIEFDTREHHRASRR